MNSFDPRGWFRLASHVDGQRGNDEQIVQDAGISRFVDTRLRG